MKFQSCVWKELDRYALRGAVFAPRVAGHTQRRRVKKLHARAILMDNPPFTQSRDAQRCLAAHGFGERGILRINFRSASGPAQTVNVFGGLTLMEVAVQGGIEQILAECGGACACGTCHVYIAPEWQHIAGPASEMESELLAGLENRRANSRLSCQINVTTEMDGLEVLLPE